MLLPDQTQSGWQTKPLESWAKLCLDQRVQALLPFQTQPLRLFCRICETDLVLRC
jgi:hypothetical protein